MPRDNRLSSRARRALRARIAAQGLPCQHPRCRYPGTPIDYRVGATGVLAYHLDEIVPRMHGGDPLDMANVRPTHAGCNSAAGARLVNAARGRRPPVTVERATLDDEW